MNLLAHDAEAIGDRASDRRFAGLALEIVENIGDGFYAVDRDWRVVYANRHACEMWRAAAETVIGRVLWERFPQLLGTEEERRLRAAAASPTMREYEVLSPIAGRWFWVRVAPLSGGLSGVYWRDIDERRQAAEALRESQERFAAMLEALPQIAFVLRPDGIAEYYNRFFVDYVGHAIGPDPDARTALQHPDDRDTLVRARKEGAATGSPYIVEARLRRHDGAYRWHVIRNAPLKRDGKVVAWLGTAIDIDDTRRAAEALRRINEELERRVAERTRDLADANARLAASETSQRDLFREAPLAMHALDAERRIIDVNDRWLDLFGYARDEVIGRKIADFHRPGGEAVHEARWEELLAKGELRDLERSFFARSGAVIEALVSVHLQRDAAGDFFRTIAVIIDVTEQRRIEAQLRQAQKMEAVGQLTGGLAHDFNNILTVILGNLDSLRHHLPDFPEARQMVEALMHAAGRAATLTHRLLAFARGEPLEPRPVDVNRLVAGMSDLMRHTLGEGIAVETALSEDVWHILADPNALESALLNLAVNGRDAMPDGGRLRIEAASLALDAGAAARQDMAPGDYVVIAVADTGTGMTEEVLAHAFEPFYTTKKVGQGTGLGLPQVYGFVKQSGGHVRIDSTLGAGTTVRLYLPRLTDAANA